VEAPPCLNFQHANFRFTLRESGLKMYAYTQESQMTTLTRIFKNGNSQAVRIPADLAFERSDMDVEIERIGDSIVIRPARRRLDQVMDKFAQFSPDFMAQGRGENEEAARDTL